MRKALAVLVTAVAVTLGLVGLAQPADAAVFGHYGHRDNYFNYQGQVTCGTCGDEIVRVGVELRTIGASSPTAYDMNVCITPLSGAAVRTSIDEEWIVKDGSSTTADTFPNNISTGTHCADLDPNVGVCGPSRSSSFLAATGVGIRRDDGALLKVTAFSNNATMPCD